MPSHTVPDLETIRSWFPITREMVYLYNGNVIPCASQVRAAMEEFLSVWSRGGDVRSPAAFRSGGRQAQE